MICLYIVIVNKFVSYPYSFSLSILFNPALGPSRKGMGVPDDWSRVYSWISADTVILEESAEKKSSYSRKCDEIPILDNYAVSPPDSFWSYFPSSPLPSTLTTP